MRFYGLFSSVLFNIDRTYLEVFRILPVNKPKRAQFCSFGAVGGLFPILNSKGMM